MTPICHGWNFSIILDCLVPYCHPTVSLSTFTFNPSPNHIDDIVPKQREIVSYLSFYITTTLIQALYFLPWSSCLQTSLFWCPYNCQSHVSKYEFDHVLYCLKVFNISPFLLEHSPNFLIWLKNPYCLHFLPRQPNWTCSGSWNKPGSSSPVHVCKCYHFSM